MSREIREVMAGYGMKHKTTAETNARGNGIEERVTFRIIKGLC